MRGEHPVSTERLVSLPGSSPHVRGALVARPVAHHGVGIIPACAGNTTAASSRRRASRDHPRMRGEHRANDCRCAATVESSPHARGALRKCYPSIRTDGIIPACAGSTRCSTSSCPACWDHPRMRGEHSPGRPTSTARSGSSPHARGALFVTSWARFKTGIIPACAGSTPCRRPCAKRRADHPRMRGEHPPTIHL